MDAFDRAEPDIPTEINHRSHRRTATTQGVVHSEETKALALAVYAETGSLQTAAHETGLPPSTIHNWISRDPEIDTKLEALRRVLRERMAWKYAEAAELALVALIDRVRDGDYHYDKEGNLTRRRIPGRELAFITSVCGDKHALLTGTMTKQRGEDQALTTLADRLVKAIEGRRGGYPQGSAQKAGNTSDIIDVEASQVIDGKG